MEISKKEIVLDSKKINLETNNLELNGNNKPIYIINNSYSICLLDLNGRSIFNELIVGDTNVSTLISDFNSLNNGVELNTNQG